jgi:hypothetical protein
MYHRIHLILEESGGMMLVAYAAPVSPVEEEEECEWQPLTCGGGGGAEHGH